MIVPLDPASPLEQALSLQRALRLGADGWAFPSVADLLAKHGVRFRPSPWPGGEHPGRVGECFAAAHEWADRMGWTYVEGLVHVPAAALWPVFDHAWCLTEDGSVADPALPDGLAAGYVGVPYSEAFRREQSGRRGDALITFGRVALGANTSVLRDGLPAGAVADISFKERS